MPSVNSPSEDVATFVNIPVTSQDVLNCNYSAWYRKFKDLTFTKAVILDTPNQFNEYLESDGIVLPKDQKDSSLFQNVEPNSDNEYSDWEEDVDSERDQEDPTKLFPEFHQKIVDTIKELGSVAPKLNWSAPQDATWMLMNNTMQCHNATDLYLLLKSSDYITHDLDHAFDCVTSDEPTPDYQRQLVLRKWANINPSMEFRCFVRDRQLIAISQRDLNYYSFLEQVQAELTEKVEEFFYGILLPKFDSNSFVFDVYVPKPFNKVYLVDVNPFARKTDSLLFTWNELAQMQPCGDNPVFRKVNERNSGRFSTKAHSQNQVPRDVVDASMDSAALIELAQQWDKLMKNEDEKATEDEEKK